MSVIQNTGTVRPFNYGDTAVRTIEVDGEPWFVLADLCKVLDIANPGNVAARIDPSSVNTIRLAEGNRGNPNVTVVNEGGMYEVVIRSDKPEAVSFRRWVTSEVLPTIRKTGSYGTAPALTEDEIVAQALAITTRKVEALTAKVEELEPKADLADTYLTAQGGARLVREVAKTLGWKEKELRRWLIEERLVFAKHAPCGNVQYDFFADFAHHFQTRETIVNHTWGSCSHYTLFILPRGVELIRKRMTRPAAGGAA